MRGWSIRAKRLRRTIASVAAGALLLQVLLLSPQPLAGGGAGLASAADATHQGHADHRAPAKPDKALHCLWCILCAKLGVALGPPPAVAALLSPVGAQAVAIAFAIALPGAVRHHSLLPIGARAPPDVG